MRHRNRENIVKIKGCMPKDGYKEYRDAST